MAKYDIRCQDVYDNVSIIIYIPANTKNWPNAREMLVQRRIMDIYDQGHNGVIC